MKVCAEPGCPELTKGTRCIWHERQKDQRRGSSKQRGYTAEYRRLRAQVIREESHCWLCGGLVDKSLKGPDPKSPSADHVVRLEDGGDNIRSNLRLSHLGCNSGRSRG
jgi:5-methylcytosine-specific restriction endonuclease McrA